MSNSVMAHRYWNTNGIGIAIVAVRGMVGDWAAYIGAEPTGQHEHDAVEAAEQYGEKLSESHAHFLFPSISGYYRR